MIKRKKKTCSGTGKFIGLGCGQDRYIFSHGLCQVCYQRANFKPVYKQKKTKPLLKFRPTIQDEQQLKQTDTFLLAWNYWEGKFFIGFDHIELKDLQAWNCIHVLDKKNYPLFKYYYKNIVLGSRQQHSLIDQGTHEKLEARILSTPTENRTLWDRFFDYRQELLTEYRQWSKDHHGIYKLG